MHKRNYIIAALVTALVFLIVLATLAPSSDQQRVGTVSPLFVSPLGVEPRGYLPLMRCDDCPTWVPTLPGDPTLTPTPTIPPTLPRP